MTQRQIIENIKDAKPGDIITAVLTGEPWVPAIHGAIGGEYALIEPDNVELGDTAIKITRIERDIPPLPTVPGTRFSAEVTRSRITKRVWVLAIEPFDSGDDYIYVSQAVFGATLHNASHINAATVTNISLPEEG